MSWDSGEAGKVAPCGSGRVVPWRLQSADEMSGSSFPDAVIRCQSQPSKQNSGLFQAIAGHQVKERVIIQPWGPWQFQIAFPTITGSVQASVTQVSIFRDELGNLVKQILGWIRGGAAVGSLWQFGHSVTLWREEGNPKPGSRQVKPL